MKNHLQLLSENTDLESSQELGPVTKRRASEVSVQVALNISLLQFYNKIANNLFFFFCRALCQNSIHRISKN